MLSHCMLSHCSLLNCWSPFSMCRQAAPGADGSCSADEHFPATERFNVIWAYAALAHSPPSDYLTHLCCHALYVLPNFSPQDISKTIWALAALKHINRVLASSDQLCSALFQLGCDCCALGQAWTGLHVCASCMRCKARFACSPVHCARHLAHAGLHYLRHGGAM